MSWAVTELNGIDLGDQRLNKRSVQVLEALGGKPSESIRTACNGYHETKAAYRFFDHEQVTPEKILAPHKEATLKRIAEEKVILCLQDTTELDFSGQKENCSTGYLNSDVRRGLYLHPTIAVTPERVCLGVLDAHIWKRESLKKHKTSEQLKEEKHWPIEKKESYRWIQSYQTACDVAARFPDKTIVSVADREGDIYELFLASEQRREAGIAADWLVRSQHDRLLAKDSSELEEKLRETARKAPILGQIEFTTHPRDKKPARKVKQTVQVIRTNIAAPLTLATDIKSIEITAILTSEIDTPKGEEPIEWLLLTSINVTAPENAFEIIQWYLTRWEIEVYFKILKSGCLIEELQLETEERMTACFSIYMIIAWRILFLTMIGRRCPDISCDIVFHEYEWKAVYEVLKKTKAPNNAIALNEMLSLIGQLGGHLNRKHDGFPGVKKIWIGMQRMKDISMAWLSLRDIYG